MLVDSRLPCNVDHARRKLFFSRWRFVFETTRTVADAKQRTLLYTLSLTLRPAADPRPGGAGRPEFNHLEMVTIYLYRQTQQWLK